MEIMKGLREKGVKEVVLTGIEISAYKDPETGVGLKALLQRLETEDTPPRIRLSSVDPLFIDEEFIEIMAASTKIMKSIHVPLQSGSDAILKSMGRNYTQAFAGDLLAKLARAIPSIGIGIDIIAGFPGEDEDLFKETAAFIEESPVYYLHVFPFSARPGTVAATMKGPLPEITKKERVRLLKKLDGQKREAFFSRFTGATMSMIAEGKVYREKYMRGYTDNYLPVHIPFEKKLENSLLEVTIDGIQEGLLMGKVI
jgi:threonylcarbamoyladenosine tRNA methylthiotransferase MtaB